MRKAQKSAQAEVSGEVVGAGSPDKPVIHDHMPPPVQDVEHHSVTRERDVAHMLSVTQGASTASRAKK